MKCYVEYSQIYSKCMGAVALHESYVCNKTLCKGSSPCFSKWSLLWKWKDWSAGVIWAWYSCSGGWGRLMKAAFLLWNSPPCLSDWKEMVSISRAFTDQHKLRSRPMTLSIFYHYWDSRILNVLNARHYNYKMNSHSLLANIANVGFSTVLKGNISLVFSELCVDTSDALVFKLVNQSPPRVVTVQGSSSHGLPGWLTRFHSNHGTNAEVLGLMRRLLNSGDTAHLETRKGNKENTAYSILRLGKLSWF